LSKEIVVSYSESIPFPVALDVGFCFYEQSVETVKRTIESVKDHVRYIFAIDGKFEFFQSDQDLSSKAVREYLCTIPNVILIDYPNRKENEKRQQYLELCKDYMTDFLLLIDADEWITDETDWDSMYSELRKKYNLSHSPKIWGVTFEAVNENIQRKKIIKRGSYPRIWQRPSLIEFTKVHNFWRFKDTGELWKSSTTFHGIKDIFIRGNDKLRTQKHVKNLYDYQVKLMKYEKPFKDEYRKVARNTAPNSPDVRLPGIPLS